MGASLTVRRYRPGDGDRVAELHEAAMRDAGAYVDGVPDPDLDDVTGSYLDAGGEFLVGVERGRIVATGAFRPVEGRLAEWLDVGDAAAELKRMRVDPERQRRGYGRRIYGELERRARERGFEEIVLDTTAAQTAARRFYEANGFEAVRRERITAFEEPFDLLCYRKSIA